MVCKAESKSHHHLGEEVQSYLVFLLQRFLSKPEIAVRILAQDYLRGLRESGHRQIEKLRDVGDICLLHAGFFPQRARTRLVTANYYVDLGIGAYYQLHHHTPTDRAIFMRNYMGVCTCDGCVADDKNR